MAYTKGERQALSGVVLALWLWWWVAMPWSPTPQGATAGTTLFDGLGMLMGEMLLQVILRLGLLILIVFGAWALCKQAIGRR